MALLDEILEDISNLHAKVSALKAEGHTGAAPDATASITDLESPEAWLRLYRFLAAVDREGAEGIDVDRQRELMRAVGYDPRASGGFFSGANASLIRDPSTDRRYLTHAGRRMIRRGRADFGDALDQL